MKARGGICILATLIISVAAVAAPAKIAFEGESEGVRAVLFLVCAGEGIWENGDGRFMFEANPDGQGTAGGSAGDNS